MQACQLTRIARVTHAFSLIHTLTRTRIIISRIDTYNLFYLHWHSLLLHLSIVSFTDQFEHAHIWEQGCKTTPL